MNAHWRETILSIVSYDKYFVGFAVFYILWERIFPVSRRRFFRKEFDQDSSLYVLDRYAVPFLFTAMGKGFMILVTPKLFYSFFEFFNGPQFQIHPIKIENDLLLFLIVFLLRDFCLYVTHVVTHRVGIFWNFHMLHHSPTQLDWLAGWRADFIYDGFIFDFASALPLTFFVVPGPMLVVLLLMETNLSFFLHANTRIQLGFLDGWINNNRVHWWHHSMTRTLSPGRSPWGHNFGAYTLIWDRIFKTYMYFPGYPTDLGLDPRLNYPKDLPLRILFPFVKLFEKMTSIRVEWGKDFKNILPSDSSLR